MKKVSSTRKTTLKKQTSSGYFSARGGVEETAGKNDMVPFMGSFQHAVKKRSCDPIEDAANENCSSRINKLTKVCEA